MAQLSRLPPVPSRITSACLARRRPAQQRRPLVIVKNNADGVNLQQAAELLAEAAVKQTQGTSLALSKEAVAELKRLNDQGKALEVKVDKLGNKLDALLKADQDAEWLMTVQTLQWAIINAELYSFKYYPSRQQYNSISSAEFAKFVLGSFVERRGHWIPNDYFVSASNSSSDAEAAKAAFRTAFTSQIHKLTGAKPRVEKEKNGGTEQYAIYRV